MLSYPWFFDTKEQISEIDKVVAVPEEYVKKDFKIVASREALDLVAYLQSLKQTPLPGGVVPEFITSGRTQKGIDNNKSDGLPDGQKLYMSTCAACHQAEGTGIPGAFPPLAGSSVVNNKDPRLMISIILQGYDARPEYAQMQGFANLLTDEEIAAIANYERTNWGNNAAKISAEDVKAIRDEVMNLNL